MATARLGSTYQTAAVETYLLGRIGFARCLALQRQLVDRVGDRDDGQIVLLLCEHPSIITIGRGGSMANVVQHARMIRTRQVEVEYVNRGGPTMLHCPGQLAIYPIVPLAWHDFSVGEFLDRFRAGLLKALDDLNLPARDCPMNGPLTDNGQLPHGIWTRTGQVATFGVAVRHWVTYHGAFLNVCPPMGLFRLIDNDTSDAPAISCLEALRARPIKMTTVRATLVRHLAEAFGCDRYHLYTGHPLLRNRKKPGSCP